MVNAHKTGTEHEIPTCRLNHGCNAVGSDFVHDRDAGWTLDSGHAIAHITNANNTFD